jgi:hypothetical protein
MKKITGLLVWALLVPTLAAAFGSGDKGQGGAQFLKIEPGARAAAMGGSVSGLADDVHAIYYNPAGLAFLKSVEMTGMHQSHFQDINYEFAAVAVPLLSWVNTKKERNAYGVMGFGLYNMEVKGIQRRGLTETDSASDTFGSNDFAYAFSYAYNLPDTGLALGFTGKFIDLNLDSDGARGFGADAGALYKWERLSIGGGLRNLGKLQRFRASSDVLPLTLYSGLGYRFSDRWLATLDVTAPRDSKFRAGFGAEYRHPFTDKFTGALRAGYSSRQNDTGGFAGGSFGMGLTYEHFGFDFAWVPYGDLGHSFRYSLTVKF